MLIRLKLEKNVSRIVFLAALTVVICGLGWFSSRHFIVRALSDQRLSYSAEVLSAAAEKMPTSPRLQRRLVEALLGSDDIDYETAYFHAVEAVRLTPQSGRLWFLLSQAQDGQGLSVEAEQSLWEAAKLAPSDSEINWALANQLVRKGQVDESVTYFRQAVQLSKTLYPMAFETLWQAGGRKVEILRAITAEKPAALVLLAQYLVEQQQYAESVQLFKGKSLPLLATLPQTNDLLNQLLQAQQPLLARQLWTEMQTSHPSLQGQNVTGVVIWDGGFETGRLFNLPHFAWSLRDSDYARVGYDHTVRAHGLSSLKFLFTGHDTTVLQNELQQRLALIPKRRYRLEVAVKTQELISPEGPRVAIVQNGIALGQSAPIASGTQDWTKLAFEFVAPEKTSEIICTIMRIPKFAYDEPTKGTIWFDDFILTELGN